MYQQPPSLISSAYFKNCTTKIKIERKEKYLTKPHVDLFIFPIMQSVLKNMKDSFPKSLPANFTFLIGFQ